MTRNGPRAGHIVALVVGTGFALAGCQSDPSPHLARVNASILTFVACTGVDLRSTERDAKRVTCDTATGAEAGMDPAPNIGGVSVFNLDNPGPLLAAPGQPAGQVTVGPYKDAATCEAVRGLVGGLGLKTYACERRFMVGKVMISR